MTTSYLFPTPIWIYDFQSKAEHNELTKLSQLALKEADEAGVIDHPYGWKSYAVDIDGDGVHSFLGLSYNAHKF